MRPRNRKSRGRDAGGWLALCTEHGAARAWLRETGSLTARLRLSGPVSVQLLLQGLRRPQRDERRVLQVAAGRVAPVREVVLRVAGRVAVYAHTAANRAALILLRRAGRRPLASVLFADPRVKAGPLYYRQLDARHPLHRAAASWCEGPAPNRLPARRALFARGPARLLVTEVFLPGSRGQT
ncbi:MAG: chorismate lyase [Sulfuritalea sp.]|nr:chorismate lyase [Sulfuritalea sp.]